MPWLIVLTLAWSLLATAATASAAVYVPGHLRDGFYTRPHFLDSPAIRYDREIKLEAEQAKPPKPTLQDQPLAPETLPTETDS